jgi:hypothetical protein
MSELSYIFDIFSGSAALKKAIRKKHTGWVVREDGAKFHFIKGVLGRDDDQPSVIYPNGTKEWFLDGQYHRSAGPAISYACGAEEYLRYGMRHCVDGPAVRLMDFLPEYWQFNQLHRIGGPANIRQDGVAEIWENGIKLREVYPESSKLPPLILK